MRSHPVFHVSFLDPYYENEFSNRKTSRRKNLNLTTDTFEKVPEKIIKKKTVNNKDRYLIKWKGLDSNKNTWVDKDQIFDRQLIQEYYRKLRIDKSLRTTYEFDQPPNDSNEYFVRHKYQPLVIDLPSSSESRRSSI